MTDIICPNCEKILPYDPEFEGYICKYCGYRQEIFKGSEAIALKMEIKELKEQLKKYQVEEINVGDIYYIVFYGNKEFKASVVEMEIEKITSKKKGVFTYTFCSTNKTDDLRSIGLCKGFKKRAFKDKAKAEKELRRLLAKRERSDGRVRQLKSNPQIAAENRAKYEAEKLEESESL